MSHHVITVKTPQGVVHVFYQVFRIQCVFYTHQQHISVWRRRILWLKLKCPTKTIKLYLMNKYFMLLQILSHIKNPFSQTRHISSSQKPHIAIVLNNVELVTHICSHLTSRPFTYMLLGQARAGDLKHRSSETRTRLPQHPLSRQHQLCGLNASVTKTYFSLNF